MADEPGQPQQHPDELDLCGTLLLDRYRLLERLGKGGMGTVYLAEHTTIGKKLAVKVLSSQYSHRLDIVQRFLQEARAASMIDQQNVVEISDFGETPDGSAFFVMEYLDGEDLGGTLKREGRLPWDRVRHMTVQICRALEAAHAAGIVHRDMKPDNCFRISRGKDPDFIKILDFGIAKVQTGDNPGGKALTQTGVLFGTPEYMAPEQAEGATTDHRVDVYAVGVIMYELLCGRVPFTGKNFMGILTKHMFEIPEAPSTVAPDADIPAEAEAIVLKALQKDPSLRFADMGEMIAAIEAVGTGAGPVAVVHETIVRPSRGPTTFAARGGEAQPVARRGRAGLWIGVVGLAAAALVGAVLLLGDRSGERDEPQAQQDAPSAAPAPAEAAPPPKPVVAAPAPSAEPVAAGPVMVELGFTTNVPAQILDAVDQAILGRTDDPAGVEFEQSDQPVALLLRAEGYEDLPVEVVPSKAKRYELTLIEQSKPGGKSPRPSSKQPTPTPSSKPSTPTPEPEPERKTVVEGDLKNPFGR